MLLFSIFGESHIYHNNRFLQAFLQLKCKILIASLVGGEMAGFLKLVIGARIGVGFVYFN